jgi:hypothetical protein
MSNVFIEESSTLDDIEYDIRVECKNEKPITIVKCWDYNLAEALLKSVKDYMNVR